MTNVSSSETLGLRCDYTNLQNATQNKHNTETNTHTAKLCLNVRGKKKKKTKNHLTESVEAEWKNTRVVDVC